MPYLFILILERNNILLFSYFIYFQNIINLYFYFKFKVIIKTDQGLLKIKDVGTNHTINKKRIKGISKTIYSQDKLVTIEKNA